jgi:ATP-binding cassette subfamily F protein 3
VEQEELKIQLNRNIEARRKELQTFVDRFRAKASKAAQARSKAKQLGRLQSIEVGPALRGVEIRIPPATGRSKLILRAEDLSVGYGPDLTVASEIDFTIERGARVAVLGANGQGKSTLLKTIAGQLDPLAGAYRWTAGLRPGFYAQHVYEAGVLDPAATVYSALERAASPSTSRQTILAMAGSFLFSGDDVEKRIGNLSGGERARVCLAGILLAGCDVLLLDEPTNHLDFDTVEALGRALQKWDGTVLFVSHDRSFVKLAATRILEVRDGAVSFYPGTYDEYVYSLQQSLNAESEQTPTGRGAQNAAIRPGWSTLSDERADGPPNLYLQRKAWQAELKHAQKQLGELERRLQGLERERETLAATLSSGSEYSRETGERFEAIGLELAECESRWLELESRADALKEQIQSAVAT